VTATLVGLDGSPTQSIPVFRLPGLSTGAIELQADLAALGQGSVKVEVHSLTNTAITATSAAVVVASPSVPADGPKITKVVRYGYYWMPTTLVLSFDQSLDPATAEDANDYRIIGPAGGVIRVKSAVYNSAAKTVTLHPSQRINIHYRYELIVDGRAPDGVTNTRGQLLDGVDNGKPGSDYRATLTWRNLVIDPPKSKSAPRPKASTNLHASRR
jgi:type VI secretion system secreted protein VgrG